MRILNNENNEKIFTSTLYIVPTPIGNLNDITYRALFILREVNFIALEDTRHTKVLLQRFSIDTPLLVFHQYNEKRKTSKILSKLRSGNSVALVSDAGTPLISDPGCYLVRACCSCGFRIIPLPGACAAVTALSASGLSTHRFCFEGFLPVTKQARINYFRSLLLETRTLIFYDSKYRILNTLEEMITIFGSERRAVLARELTKIWESIYRGSLQELLEWVNCDRICVRGEMVLILEGNVNKNSGLQPEIIDVIRFLRKELSFKKMIDFIVNIYGINKNVIYNYLLKNKL